MKFSPVLINFISAAIFSLSSMLVSADLLEDRAITVSAYVGSGKAKVGNSFENENFNVNNTFDYVAARWSGAYTFKNRLVLQGAMSFSLDFDVFDAIDDYFFMEEQLFLGYRFSLSDDSFLIPKIGVSFWNVEVTEGQLFNSGPEESASVSGRDAVYELEIGHAFNKLFSMSLYTSYMDAGEVYRTNSGIGFNFHF